MKPRRLICPIVLAGTPLFAQESYTVDVGKPLLELSAFRGDPFGTIKGALTLPNGNVAVLDESNSSVFFFASSGKPVAKFGRRGRGPGEFRFMASMGMCNADGLSVYDSFEKRITEVSNDGRFIRTTEIMDIVDNRSPYRILCAVDGSRVVVERPQNWDVIPNQRTGPHRIKVSINISNASKDYIPIGVFSGPERFLWPKSDGPRPFGKEISVAVSDRIFVGTADSFFVEVFDLKGKKLGDIRHELQPKRFTYADRQKYYRDLQDRRQSQGFKVSTRQIDEVVSAALPDKLPIYERFIADRQNVWIQEGSAPTDAATTWWGFDTNGKLVGTITVPTNFHLFEIRNADVLGKWTNSEWAESVRHYRLVRSTK